MNKGVHGVARRRNAPIVGTSVFGASVYGLFGVEPKHFKVKKIRGKLLWRMESKLRARAALSNHIKSIFKKTSITNSSGPRKRSRYAPLLDVGVMCDSYTCTVDLPAESIGLMTQRGVGIQQCCYPTDFGRK